MKTGDKFVKLPLKNEINFPEMSVSSNTVITTNRRKIQERPDIARTI